MIYNYRMDRFTDMFMKGHMLITLPFNSNLRCLNFYALRKLNECFLSSICYCFKCVVTLKPHSWVSPTEVSADIIKTTFHINIVYLLSHCGIWMESHVILQL